MPGVAEVVDVLVEAKRARERSMLVNEVQTR